MARSRRPSIAWHYVLATAAHVAALLVVARAYVPPRDAPRVAEAGPIEIELRDEPAPPSEEPTPSPEPIARSEARAPRANAASEGPNAREPAASTNGVEGAPAREPAAATSSSPERPHLSLEALGVAGPNRFMGTAREAEAAEAKEREQALTRAITEPLFQRDVALGLGADGPVVAALEEATMGSVAPVDGRAVFRVTADALGAVIEVVALDVSHDRRGWDDVAGRALGNLRGRALRMPSRSGRDGGAGARGVTMRVEVVSAYKLPSGHDPGIETRILGIPVTRGAGKQSTRIDLLDPIPKLSTVEIQGPGNTTIKVPQVQVGITLLNIAGDPADIGARARRIVHAKVIDEQLL